MLALLIMFKLLMLSLIKLRAMLLLLAGRLSQPLNGCPGSVAKYFGRASMFQVRYMHPANPKGRAKMLKRVVTHEELMEIILPDTGEEDDNDDEVEESDEEVEEEEEEEEEEDLEGADD